MVYIKLNYIELNQNIGSFFLCKMSPKFLHLISNKNLSRYKDLEDGIQRDLSKHRTKEIKEYLKTQDATFPNTIIISINNTPGDTELSYIINDKSKELSILMKDGVANILDGQHRLSGFDKSEENFELPVSVFLDLPLSTQAKIFAKINSTHTRVPLDLVYELFGMSDGRSVEKSAYSIVKQLNENDDSPWKNKIKTLTERDGDMAQGSFAKYIDKQLLSKDKILNNLYEKDRDYDVLQMLKNYFNAVKNVFPKEWNNKENYILTKTTGFVGFMMFFKDLIKIVRLQKIEFTNKFCEDIISRSKNNFLEFTSDNYESGAIGQQKIRNILRESLTSEEKVLLNIK